MDVLSASFGNITNTSSLDVPSNSNVATTDPGSSSTSSLLKTVHLVSYAVLCVVGIVGNTMVFLASRRSRMAVIVSNIFIANLTLADLTVSVVNIPTVAAYGYLVYWPFGLFLCKCVPYFQGITLCASVGTLVAIAAERYWHLVRYKRRKLTVCQAYKAIAIIWLLSVFIPSPIAVFNKTIHWKFNGKEVDICIEQWPNEKAQQVFATMLFVLLYFIPLLLISVLYWKTGRFLRSLPAMQKVTYRAQKKVTWMILTVTLLFALCWMPYHIVFLYVDLTQAKLTPALTSLILFNQWLVFANSACNPFVFTAFNRNYRREFKVMICKRPACARPSYDFSIDFQNN